PQRLFGRRRRLSQLARPACPVRRLEHRLKPPHPARSAGHLLPRGEKDSTGRHLRLGRLSPCSRAASFAISYPASACRITPVAGSFHSTRSRRFAASGVPSATMTTPECWL